MVDNSLLAHALARITCIASHGSSYDIDVCGFHGNSSDCVTNTRVTDSLAKTVYEIAEDFKEFKTLVEPPASKMCSLFLAVNERLVFDIFIIFFFEGFTVLRPRERSSVDRVHDKVCPCAPTSFF